MDARTFPFHGLPSPAPGSPPNGPAADHVTYQLRLHTAPWACDVALCDKVLHPAPKRGGRCAQRGTRTRRNRTRNLEPKSAKSAKLQPSRWTWTDVHRPRWKG